LAGADLSYRKWPRHAAVPFDLRAFWTYRRPLANWPETRFYWLVGYSELIPVWLSPRRQPRGTKMIYCFCSLFFGPAHRVARGSVHRVVTEVEDVGLYPTSRSNQSIDTQTVIHVARRQKAETGV